MPLSPIRLDERREASRPGAATERVGIRDGVERKAQLRELKECAAEQNVEVQLKPLPEANVVVIRFVDRATGHVIQEYPSEHLATALAEMRAKINDDCARLNRCA